MQAGNISLPVSIVNTGTLSSGAVLPGNMLGNSLVNGGLLNTNRLQNNGNLVPNSSSFGLGAGIKLGSPSQSSPAGNALSQAEGVLTFGRGAPVPFGPSAFPPGDSLTSHPPPRKESQPMQMLLQRQVHSIFKVAFSSCVPPCFIL